MEPAGGGTTPTPINPRRRSSDEQGAFGDPQLMHDGRVKVLISTL